MAITAVGEHSPDRPLGRRGVAGCDMPQAGSEIVRPHWQIPAHAGTGLERDRPGSGVLVGLLPKTDC